MTIKILKQAEQDLSEGFRFYEDQGAGIGGYFLTSLLADIECLRIYGGFHPLSPKTHHRLLAKRFPFAIFYTLEDQTVSVHAVLECRAEPIWKRKKSK